MSAVYFFRHELGKFQAEAERALALNPNSADTLALIGQFLAFSGNWERGVALVKKAMKLNPDHPGWYHYSTGKFQFSRGDYGEALAEFHKLDSPDFWITHLVLVYTYGHLGKLDEAETAFGATQ